MWAEEAKGGKITRDRVCFGYFELNVETLATGGEEYLSWSVDVATGVGVDSRLAESKFAAVPPRAKCVSNDSVVAIVAVVDKRTRCEETQRCNIEGTTRIIVTK